jgi:DNA-binding CsgD family transcriptional regulator
VIGKFVIIGSFISTLAILYMLYGKNIVELTTQNVNYYQSGYIIEIIFILISIRLRYISAEEEQKQTIAYNATLLAENKIKEQHNLLLQQENDISILKAQLMQQEIFEKDKEIAVSTIRLTQNDLLVSNLHEKLSSLKTVDNEINKNEINQLVQNLNTFRKDTFWTEFEYYFEQMHNGFFSKINKEYPKLTENDKRLCAFLKLGMTSKEIANLTHRNYKSIEVLRVRLRKKLGIEKERTLKEFLNSI